MINKIKTLILSLAATFAFAAPGLVPAMASAQTTEIGKHVCRGADALIVDQKVGDCSDVNNAGAGGIGDRIKTIINWISALIGVVAVIMIIFGGFRYITSGGNDTSVASAKKTILYALVGLVIVALSQLIVKFVLTNVS
jgi:hypothetical protein